MKKIVFLVGSYYPNYSAVGRCAGNVAEILAKDYAVTAIAMKTHSGESEKVILNAQKLIRIATSSGEKRLKILQKLKKTKGITRFCASLSLYIWRIKNTLRVLLGRDSLDRKLVEKYSEALNAEDEPDAIISVCMPYEAVMAAVAYKKSHPNVILIPYLFDKFSVNRSLHRSKLNRKLKMKRHLALEREMTAAANKLVFVESWAEHLKRYFSEFSDKFILTEHPLLMDKEGEDKAKCDGKLSIVYTGSIIKSVRSAKYFLQLITPLLRDQKNIMIQFYGGGSGLPVVEQYAGSFPEQIISYGFVSAKSATEAMRESDVLLSLGSKDTTQLSSKIFEYMAAGKPIIHTYYDENDPTLKILKVYPMSLVLKENDFSIIEFQKLSDFLVSKRFKTFDFDEVSALFPTARPSYTADLIKSIIEG